MKRPNVVAAPHGVECTLARGFQAGKLPWGDMHERPIRKYCDENSQLRIRNAFHECCEASKLFTQLGTPFHHYSDLQVGNLHIHQSYRRPFARPEVISCKRGPIS